MYEVNYPTDDYTFRPLELEHLSLYKYTEEYKFIKSKAIFEDGGSSDGEEDQEVPRTKK